MVSCQLSCQLSCLVRKGIWAAFHVKLNKLQAMSRCFQRRRASIFGGPACSKFGLFQCKVNLPEEIYPQTAITVCEIGSGEISGIVHSHHYRQEHGIKQIKMNSLLFKFPRSTRCTGESFLYRGHLNVSIMIMFLLQQLSVKYNLQILAQEDIFIFVGKIEFEMSSLTCIRSKQQYFHFIQDVEAQFQLG